MMTIKEQLNDVRSKKKAAYQQYIVACKLRAQTEAILLDQKAEVRRLQKSHRDICKDEKMVMGWDARSAKEKALRDVARREARYAFCAYMRRSGKTLKQIAESIGLSTAHSIPDFVRRGEDVLEAIKKDASA